MKDNEATLMVECLLRDLRGNWNDPKGRAEKAMELSKKIKTLHKHVKAIDEYFEYAAEGDWDGRHFRMSYLDGGYENMENLHGLKMTFHDKSVEFRKIATEYITFPECLFKDWK